MQRTFCSHAVFRKKKLNMLYAIMLVQLLKNLWKVHLFAPVEVEINGGLFLFLFKSSPKLFVQEKMTG